MTCYNGDLLAIEMLYQWLKFYGAQRVGPGIEPYRRYSLKEGRVPYWMSRSELYKAEIDPISGVHYREVEISHGFYAIIRFKGTYFSRFWIFISDSSES